MYRRAAPNGAFNSPFGGIGGVTPNLVFFSFWITPVFMLLTLERSPLRVDFCRHDGGAPLAYLCPQRDLAPAAPRFQVGKVLKFVAQE